MNGNASRPRVGILALTLKLYERLAPGLRARREHWLQSQVLPALSPIADVRFSRASFCRKDVDAIVAGFDADGCDAIAVLCLTYSPSQISLAALQRTRLPIVLWNVQELLTDAGSSLAEIARQWTPVRRTVSPNEHSMAYRSLRDDYLSLFHASTASAIYR